MLFEAIVVALISAFYIGFEDGKISAKKTLMGYGIGFFITAIVVTGWLWLTAPAFVGILGGWYRVLILPMLIFSAAALMLEGSEEPKASAIQGMKILFVLIGAVYLSLTSVFYANELHSIPEVESYDNISAGKNIFAPIDTEHVRLVDQEMAYYLGNKIIGESKENLGSQFEVRKRDFHIQKVNDRLYWVAPLQFRGIWKWMDVQASPGFVMVDAEDPYTTPSLHLGYQMKYLPSAYWGKQIHRYIYLKGYEHIRLEDFTFEVTDSLTPRYVISLTYPTVLNSGDKTKGVIVINPETGKIEEYAIGSTPEWVDRVVPETVAKNYLLWYGMLGNGWWNTILSEKNVNVPTSISRRGRQTELWLIYGSDGEPYWYTGMTSPSGSDQSLTSIMLVSLKTGEIYMYKTGGANEQAVIDAVDSEVSMYSNWYGSVPIPYNVYGQLTYIVPIAAHTERGYIFKEVAFVDASNVNVKKDENKAKALEKYKLYLFSKGKEIAITSSASMKTIKGVVERMSSISMDGTSSFRIWLSESNIIYAVDPILMPEVSVTSVGDAVNISYDDTNDTVVGVSAFDNLEINSRISKAQLEMEKHEAEREVKDSEWVRQKEITQELEDLRQG